MQEIFPIASGFIIGLGVQEISNPKLRTAALLVSEAHCISYQDRI
jgi:hypothetical protein